MTYHICWIFLLCYKFVLTILCGKIVHCTSLLSTFHMFLWSLFNLRKLKKGGCLVICRFDQHKDCVGASGPVMCIQAKIRSLPAWCGGKHYWVYLGKLSKLSLSEYVQFHLKTPKGWWLGFGAFLFSHTHPPAHKFSHSDTPIGHDPSGFFLLLWFPESKTEARAG